MNAKDADVVWTRHTDQVRVEPHLSGWKRTPGDYWMPATSIQGGERASSKALRDLLGMFVLFNTIVVRDHVPVEAAHRAFLKIDEYRAAISLDTPGAEPL